MAGCEGQRDEALEGVGVREHPPEEDRRRAGAGHRHPKGGGPAKLLSIRPGGGLPSSTFGGALGSPNVGRARRSVSPGPPSATWAVRRPSWTALWSSAWSCSHGRTRALATV